MVVPGNAHVVAIHTPNAIMPRTCDATKPVISPDGTTVVYSGTTAGDVEWGPYAVSVTGGAPTVLYDVPGNSENDPAYSPRGRVVALSSLAGPGE